MKKVCVALLCFFIIGLASCKWIPDQDYSGILNKTTYNSFENLNNPLMLSFQKLTTFKLSGTQNQETHSFGSVYVIYDWENETVHDFVFGELHRTWQSGFRWKRKLVDYRPKQNRQQQNR